MVVFMTLTYGTDDMGARTTYCCGPESKGPAAAFLLYIGFMTSFGGLVRAAAVMFPPDDDGRRAGA
jgi:hypothetical protein